MENQQQNPYDWQGNENPEQVIFIMNAYHDKHNEIENEGPADTPSVFIDEQAFFVKEIFKDGKVRYPYQYIQKLSFGDREITQINH
jgi:hypothetical protein